MDIGLAILPTADTIDTAVLVERAEALGFESLWAPEQNILPLRTERPVPRLWGDIVDPMIALARASAASTTIKLGTAVSIVPERDPLILAKQVATLDMYSGGRFLFGIGVGSGHEQAQIMGADFPHRWTHAKEAVMAMKALWTSEVSEFHGQYYDFPPLYCFPKPAQQPHPPVLLGGKARNVFKRIAAWGDGWIPINVSPREVELGRSTLERLAIAAGRDPASLTISVVGVAADRHDIEHYNEAGADRAIVSLEAAGTTDSLAELEQLAEAVLH
ncbi:MAG: hypothetical protein CL878_10555 [Dehalococcoidia bacterium]|nr:hypothetical protein [Dehalococcoidia bacterium]